MYRGGEAMKWFRSVPLVLAASWILVTPSCRSHFETGTIEVMDPSGHRTLYSQFHNGQLGKIGHGALFRAQLQDGSVVMIESAGAEEKK